MAKQTTPVENDILDGLDTLELGGGERYPFLNENLGIYNLKLVEAKEFSSRENLPTFKAVVDVISSTGANPLPAGTRATIMFKASIKFPQYYLRDVAYFTAALLNEPASSVKKSTVRMITGEEQGAAGTTFVAQVDPPKEGKEYNVIRFRPAENGGQMVGKA